MDSTCPALAQIVYEDSIGDVTVGKAGPVVISPLCQPCDSTAGTPLLFGMYDVATNKPTGARRTASVSVPSREQIMPILTNELEALKFLESRAIFDPPRLCPSCFGKLSPMSKRLDSKSHFVIRCRAHKCTAKYTSSIFVGSILANCKYNKAKFIDFAYHWLLGSKMKVTRLALGMSPKTVTDWSNYLREAVTFDLLMNDECQIGGPGIIVEIDESKFGKRKYHVSHRMGVWSTFFTFLT